MSYLEFLEFQTLPVSRGLQEALKENETVSKCPGLREYAFTTNFASGNHRWTPDSSTCLNWIATNYFTKLFGLETKITSY